jgi:hypothetical protein
MVINYLIFSPCSAEKEDRSRGIIRKEGEGEEEKKGKREKRSKNGRCF